METTAATMTAAAEVEATMAQGSDLICEECGGDILHGEALTLDHGVLCPSCAWDRATHLLSPLLVSCWTEADVEAGRRDYEEASYLVAVLSLRIGNRLARRA